MRGLTVIVAEAARLPVALELTAAQAALGGRARIFCQGVAVAGLREAAALPLIDDALALGVEITACQSGLALLGLEASALDPRFAYDGLIGILQTLGEDRLLLA